MNYTRPDKDEDYEDNPLVVFKDQEQVKIEKTKDSFNGGEIITVFVVEEN